MGESWERGYQKVTTCLCVCLLCCVSASGPVFNRSNVLQAVEGVGDWWSEGDYRCRGGGLGYWLAVSKAKGEEILELHRDEPVKQREALIAFWFAVNRFLTWERVSGSAACGAHRACLTHLHIWAAAHRYVHHL